MRLPIQRDGGYDHAPVGGKAKGRGAGYRGNRTWVAGAIQRGGRVRIERIPDVKKATLHDFVRRTVSAEAEAIYTDELNPHFSHRPARGLRGRGWRGDRGWAKRVGVRQGSPWRVFEAANEEIDLLKGP